MRPRRAHDAVARRLQRLAAMPRCAGCERPQVVCVCDRLVPLPTPLSAAPLPEVWVLRHPGERDHVLGSAPLLLRLLPRGRLVDGLSWRSWGAVCAAAGAAAEARRSPAWAVLWPLGWPSSIAPPPPGQHQILAPGVPPVLRDAPPAGLLVLDGTWSQAKALWWRNPWLLGLPRMRVTARAPSAFGRLRRAPRPEHLSTLESVAASLEGLGVAAEVPAALRRCLRTLTQRVRDWPCPGAADGR